jgi:hypothetical protein
LNIVALKLPNENLNKQRLCFKSIVALQQIFKMCKPFSTKTLIANESPTATRMVRVHTKSEYQMMTPDTRHTQALVQITTKTPFDPSSQHHPPALIYGFSGGLKKTFIFGRNVTRIRILT